MWQCLLICLLAVGSDWPQTAPTSNGTHPVYDNAAWYYWRAIVKKQPVLERNDLRVPVFIEETLCDLSPQRTSTSAGNPVLATCTRNKSYI